MYLCDKHNEKNTRIYFGEFCKFIVNDARIYLIGRYFNYFGQLNVCCLPPVLVQLEIYSNINSMKQFITAFTFFSEVAFAFSTVSCTGTSALSLDNSSNNFGLKTTATFNNNL